MALWALTPEQREAVEAAGGSVIVSAAAGSGKTAVLAQRCAYLICDAPPHVRCQADQLLVVTFTEAAAAEMRRRIMECIRRRADANPADHRLREQLRLLEHAQISTIHAFCLWMIRRWFVHVGIDPMADIMTAEEANLLQRETLEEVFESLYEQGRRRGDRAESSEDIPDETKSGEAGINQADSVQTGSGKTVSCETKAGGVKWRRTESGKIEPGRVTVDTSQNETLAESFIRLVEDYGLGDDRSIREFVLSLRGFLNSLTDPGVWLDDALAAVTKDREQSVLNLALDLEKELSAQAVYCTDLVDELSGRHAVCAFYAQRIDEYARQLRQWEEELAGYRKDSAVFGTSRSSANSSSDHSDASTCLKRFESVRARIADYQFSRSRAPSLEKEASAQVRVQRDEAQKLFTETVKNRLFQKRLKKPYSLFSVAEWLDGLARIAPYMRTLIQLVTSFRETYSDKKLRLGVMDFADLERSAYNLLTASAKDSFKGGSETSADVLNTLHRRFVYVLVDEYQDVNPIQQAILSQVSHEPVEHRANNLFVVGDVKQSIYRFRLAEPRLFLERLAMSHQQQGSHRAIALQRNFRSRVEILEAVNSVFRCLMRQGESNIEFDSEAELRPGFDPSNPAASTVVQDFMEPLLHGHGSDRCTPDAATPDAPSRATRHPVELQLFECKPQPVEDDTEDQVVGDVAEDQAWNVMDPQRGESWSIIQREAYWIGRRIQEMIKTQELTPEGRALRYDDIAVLLRATRVHAQEVTSTLHLMGIPAYAAVAGTLLNVLEVREVLAALHVLDNPKQDIPLASVLRSGIFGGPLTEDELAAVRLIDREIPFHAAVWRYAERGSAERGSDEPLRERLVRILRRIGRYRQASRQRPTADVLWRLYHEQGYLAHVAGRSRGGQRQANLITLHELAREFGTYRKQGLHRFLRFIEALQKREQDINAASLIGEGENAVRIISVHQSKGLEFPVVFLAGLGSQFHFGDRSGKMIFERQTKIGLKVVDPERLIEYPSVAHVRVVSEIERATREEEMRILYVAMTRAKEKLILVGSIDGLKSVADSFADSLARNAASRPPSVFEIQSARTWLDWLVPVIRASHVRLGQSNDRRANCPPYSTADHSIFIVDFHDSEEIGCWSIEQAGGDDARSVRRAVAGLNPLPESEPVALDDDEISGVLSRMNFVYPHWSAAALPALSAASQYAGSFDGASLHDPIVYEGRQEFHQPEELSFGRISRTSYVGGKDAIRCGQVVHLVLQHLDFQSACDEGGLASELRRLTEAGIIGCDERGLVDEQALVWFVSTPLARSIREAGLSYRRELAFIAKESARRFDMATSGDLDDDAVLVRGIVDGVWPLGDGVQVVDFKTDRVAEQEVLPKAERYRPQMQLYASAVSRLYNQPVRAVSLAFLSARRIVTWDEL